MQTYRDAQSNFINDNINPCVEESQLSFKCLEKNAYDSKKCLQYFENYKNCKKFWAKVVRQRKLMGITPHVPSPEERKQIVEELQKKHGIANQN